MNDTKTVQYTIDIIKFDLWGNEKDGFDNNDSTRINRHDLLDGFDGDAGLQLLEIAQDEFSGYSYAMSANKIVEMKPKAIAIEWSSGDANELIDGEYDIETWDVNYRGNLVGELRIKRIGE